MTSALVCFVHIQGHLFLCVCFYFRVHFFLIKSISVDLALLFVVSIFRHDFSSVSLLPATVLSSPTLINWFSDRICNGRISYCELWIGFFVHPKTINFRDSFELCNRRPFEDRKNWRIDELSHEHIRVSHHSQIHIVWLTLRRCQIRVFSCDWIFSSISNAFVVCRVNWRLIIVCCSTKEKLFEWKCAHGRLMVGIDWIRSCSVASVHGFFVFARNLFFFAIYFAVSWVCKSNIFSLVYFFCFVSTGVPTWNELSANRQNHRFDGRRVVIHFGRIHLGIDVHASSCFVRSNANTRLDSGEGINAGNIATGEFCLFFRLSLRWTWTKCKFSVIENNARFHLLNIFGHGKRIFVFIFISFLLCFIRCSHNAMYVQW